MINQLKNDLMSHAEQADAILRKLAELDRRLDEIERKLFLIPIRDEKKPKNWYYNQ